MTERKKVLLVDDVELFLELQKTFFRRESFELLVARNGREAYETIERQRPDLVFMDLYMPEMAGDECCRKVKNHPELRSTPIVMVTHGGRQEELARCRDAGCDAVVLKPINRHQFLETARNFLDIVDRMAPRIGARLRIRYGGSEQRVLTDYSVNLSTGGVFIESNKLLNIDTPLDLEFEIPGRSEPIRCQGRVAWTNHPDRLQKPNLPAGMGIQFTDLKMENLESLREYIKKELLSPTW